MPNGSKHLIIAGAEKSGTTSLYAYLAAHPDVCPSRRKETDYFRRDEVSAAAYLAEFPIMPGDARSLLESSPGYLAEATAVAPRIAQLVPQARLIFLLRDPVDRVRSSFRFYKSRLHVPQDMSFDQFVRCCLAHEAGRADDRSKGMLAWHLRALARSRYDELIPAFERCFPSAQILLLSHKAMHQDVRRCTQQAASFAGLDPAFFDDFEFTRENVSFLARHGRIQALAIWANDRFEGIWRRHPALKQRLLKLYKSFNQRPLDEDTLSDETQQQLTQHFAATRHWLQARGL